MLVKDLIEKLQRIPAETTVYVLEEQGFDYFDVELMYDEQNKVVGIVTDYNNF